MSPLSPTVARLACASLLLVLAACGDKSSSSNNAGGATAAGTGCIQGVVVDGLAGTRVPLRAGVPHNGVFVLVRNQLMQATLATPNPDDAAANPHLIGEYHLCGIPLDETFPVFVWHEGYLPFESLIEVASTAPARTPTALEDVRRHDPSELVNVRIWPLAQEVKDLEVLVHYDGAPLAGATVTLRAVGSNFLSPDGAGYLPPLDVRSATQRLVTDDTGRAVFPAASLALGGHYTYTVTPPEGGLRQTAASDFFVLGLRAPGDEDLPYRIDVDLRPSIVELVELSRSTDAANPEPNGKLAIYFNREIELVPGTADGVTAALSGATTARLKADQPGNKTSEQVRITIEGNRLLLEPTFEAKPDTDISKELGLQISYTGIQVRPKAAPHTLESVAVSGTVNFYR